MCFNKWFYFRLIFIKLLSFFPFLNKLFQFLNIEAVYAKQKQKKDIIFIACYKDRLKSPFDWYRCCVGWKSLINRIFWIRRCGWSGQLKPPGFLLNFQVFKGFWNFPGFWLWKVGRSGINTQPAFTFSKLTIETLEEGVKYVQIKSLKLIVYVTWVISF